MTPHSSRFADAVLPKAYGKESAADADGGVLSDAELAWRLHQELNAGPAMLRARSRKPASAGNSSGAEPLDKADTKRGKSVAKGTTGTEADSIKVGSPVTGPSLRSEGPVKLEDAKEYRAAENFEPGDGKRDEPVSPRATRHQHREKQAEPKVKDKEEERSVVEEKKETINEHRSRKGRPKAAATGGMPLSMAAPPQKVTAGKPAKPVKIPKLPMVLQGKQWYRARLLKETSEKVLVEFAGFEHMLPSLWLPRASDRIWFGSYKGKDWRYLGDGAWEPKAGIKNRVFSTLNGTQSSVIANKEGEKEAASKTRGGVKRGSSDHSHHDHGQSGAEVKTDGNAFEEGFAGVIDDDETVPEAVPEEKRQRRGAHGDCPGRSTNTNTVADGGHDHPDWNGRPDGEPVVVPAVVEGSDNESESLDMNDFRGNGVDNINSNAAAFPSGPSAGRIASNPSPTPETPSTRLGARKLATPGGFHHHGSPRAANGGGRGGRPGNSRLGGTREGETVRQRRPMGSDRC